jgi:hypothetical protein
MNLEAWKAKGVHHSLLGHSLFVVDTGTPFAPVPEAGLSQAVDDAVNRLVEGLHTAAKA